MSTLALVWDLIAIDNASGTFGKVGAEAETAHGKIGKLAAGLGAAALGGALAYSVKQAADFQSQMVMIGNMAGKAGQSVQGMTSQILALAGQVAQSPEAVATSLYHVTSVGLKGTDALKAVKIAAEGAAIGHADLEQTTNSLTSAIASGIAPGETYSQMMSSLLTIVGTGDMSMEQLNDSLSNGILQTMPQYGVNLEQVGAGLAAFGDGNIRGANAATQLRMAVQAVTKVTQAGPAILAKYGMSQKGLVSDLQTGGLTKLLDDMHGKLAAAGVKTNELGAILTEVFGRRAGVGLGVLLQEFDRYHQKLAEEQDATNTLSKKYAAVQKTATFQFKSLEDTMQGVAIKVGTKLLPALGSVATWIASTGIPKVESLASSLDKALHSGTAQSVTKGVKGVLDDIVTTAENLGKRIDEMWTKVATSGNAKQARKIIGEVIDGLDGVVKTIGDWGGYALDALQGIGTVALPILGGLLGLVGAIAKGFSDLPGPIRDVVGALAGIVILTKTNLFSGLLGTGSAAAAKAAAAQVGGARTSQGTGLRGALSSTIGRGSAAVKATGGYVGGLASTFGDARASSVQGSRLFPTSGPRLSVPIPTLGSISGVGAALAGFGGSSLSATTSGLSKLRDIIMGTAESTGLWADATDGARTRVGLLPAAVGGVGSAFSTAKDALSTFGQGVDNTMIGANASVSRFASAVTDGAHTVGAKFVELKTGAEDYFGQLREYATTPAFDSWVPFRTLQAAAGDAKNALSNLATDAMVRVQSGASTLGSSLRTAGSTVTASLRDMATNAGVALREIPRQATEALGSLTTTIRTKVGEAGSALSTGLSTGWANVKTATSSAVTEVKGTLAGFGAALDSVATTGFGKLRSAAGGLMDALGGPWGLAIAGTIAVLPPLISWLAQTGKAYGDVTVKTDDLTTALANNDGAIDANIRKLAASDLQKAGLFKAAGSWGVSSTDLVNASMGDPAAIKKVTDAANAYSKAQLNVAHSSAVQADQTGIAADAYTMAARQSDGWLRALLGVKGTIDGTIATQKQQDLAVYGNVKSVADLKGALDTMGVTSATTWNGSTVTLQGASAQQIQALKNIGAQVGILQADGSVTITVGANTKPAADVINSFLDNVAKNGYVGALLGVKPMTGTVTGGSSGLIGMPNLKIPGHALGGLIAGAGSGTSDSILSWLSNGEFVVNAQATAKWLPMLKKINAGLPAFAGGGPVGRIPMPKASTSSEPQPLLLQLDGQATTDLLDGRIVTFATTATNRGRY